MRSITSIVVAVVSAGLFAGGALAEEPALRLAIEAAHLPEEGQQALLEAYAERGGLMWLQGGAASAQALAIAGRLARADEHGLAAADYAGADLAARLAGAGTLKPDERAALDVAFSAVTLAFLEDLTRGRVDPRAVHWKLGVERPALPWAQLLARLAVAGDVSAALDEVETPFPVYRRTQAALRDYLALAARGEGLPLPAWPSVVEPGSAPEGLDALAARLVLLSDLPRGFAPPQLYEGALVEGVQRFQARHGLLADGRIDRLTAHALSVPMVDRVQQLAFALERLRWLPRDLSPPLLVVNIPQFELQALAPPGEPSLSMKVVVGRAYHHRTPVFIDDVRAVQFHPFWNVPADIAQTLLPKLVAEPAHAAAQGLELVDAQGRVSALPQDPATAATLRLRQRPGPANALGPIKLEMENPYEIYLHGTPSTELFSRARRDFSHGCIRVEDPGALAAWVLARTPGWSEERVRAAVAASEPLRVPLASPLRVLILYSTAAVTADGRVSFFDDVYGADALLERALAHDAAAHLAPQTAGR